MKRELVNLFIGLIACLLLNVNICVAIEQNDQTSYQVATFAGGCFWCMEPVYDQIVGVVDTTVGYTGGHTDHPTYEEVSKGGTGHTEAIQVLYDPNIVTYDFLVDMFWKNIDPTVKDAQFCDRGSQYRSAIFYHSEQEKKTAESSAVSVRKRFGNVYTEIEPAGKFFPAEEYHQNYYIKNPVRYKLYRYLCGRDTRLQELWGL